MGWEQSIAVIISVFSLIIGLGIFLIRELRQISRDIHLDMKDFHGRLCRLEERYLEIKDKKK